MDVEESSEGEDSTGQLTAGWARRRISKVCSSMNLWFVSMGFDMYPLQPVFKCRLMILLTPGFALEDAWFLE